MEVAKHTGRPQGSKGTALSKHTGRRYRFRDPINLLGAGCIEGAYVRSDQRSKVTDNVLFCDDMLRKAVR